MKWTFKALAAACAMALSTAAAVAQEIKFGFNADISASPSALVGQSGLAAIEVAIEDINAAGGLLGRPVRLIVRDDLSQPPKAIQNMSELIDNEKVVAVFGPSNSGNAMAWKSLVTQKKTPIMVSMGTGTDITKPMSPGAPNYIFRISLVDRDNASALLAYLKKRPEAKKIGFMVETTGYGQGALKDLEELSSQYGIKPMAVEKFGVNDTDMTSQLNKLRNAGIDTLVVWAQATPLGQVMRSMEKLNYFPLTLTSWVADQQPFVDAAGPKLLDKPLFMRTRVGGDMSQDMAKLYERIKPKIKLGAPIIAQASHSYDATMLLAAAIKQAGSTDGEKVRLALEDLRAPHKGLMKTYDKPFSAEVHEGLLPSDYHWIKWANGQAAVYSDDTIKSLTPTDYKR